MDEGESEPGPAEEKSSVGGSIVPGHADSQRDRSHRQQEGQTVVPDEGKEMQDIRGQESEAEEERPRPGVSRKEKPRQAEEDGGSDQAKEHGG